MSHSIYFQVAVLAAVLAIVEAQNATSNSPPSSTGATSMVAWQSGPTQRGTLMLIWSCVATIITCTWSILHLNVPSRFDRPWAKRLRKLKWMAITVLFPEFTLAKAICELKDAVDDLHKMKEHESQLNWEVEFESGCQRLHRIFHLFENSTKARHEAMVGAGDSETRQTPEKEEAADDERLAASNLEQATPGAELQSPEVDQSGLQEGSAADAPEIGENNIASTSRSSLPSSEREGDLASQVHAQKFVPFRQGGRRYRDAEWTEYGDVWSEEWIPWTLTHSYFANMGGFDEELDTRMYGPITASFMLQRCLSMKSDYNLFPSSQEIEDKSKADLLVKLLAVSQISWLVTSVIARGITGLAVSQLEILTVAFSVMAIATYVANLGKPKDVDMPIMLRIPGRSEGLGTAKEIQEGHESRSFIKSLFTPSKTQYGHRPRMPNDTFRIIGPVPLISSLTAGSTMVFGGLHCIAWTFNFPSKAEVLLWRISSVVSAAVPCLALIGSLLLLWLIGLRRVKCREFTTSYLRGLDMYADPWWSSFARGPTRSQFEAFLRDSEAPEIYRRVPQRRLEQSALAKLDLNVASEEKIYRVTKLDRQHWNSMVFALGEFEENWRNLQSGRDYDLVRSFRLVQECWERFQKDPAVAAVWGKYESFVRDKLRAEGHPIPDGSFIEYLLAHERNVLEAEQDLENFKHLCDSVSRSLTIFAGVVYSIARVALLVVAFTSLRSVPDDLYTTSWTRFMPHVS